MKIQFTLICSLLIATSFLPYKMKVKVCAGKVERHEDFASNYVQSRMVDVYLPQGYTKNKKYAVLYMHDGQMLFDTTYTWNHQEWGVDETVNNLILKNKIKDCIVVGIWNVDGKRHAEYFPEKPFRSLTQVQQDSLYAQTRNGNNKLFGDTLQSNNYLKFIVQELKPFIDKKYSTKTDATNTCIAGSSMGGLISMYAICEYPDVFGAAACISTHWPGVMPQPNNPVPEAFYQYLQNNLPSAKNHKIYFDYGTETLDAMYKPLQVRVDKIMKQKKYSSKNWITKEFVGADHSEKSWRSRLNIPLEFMLGK